jgi:hypothetical protein
MLSLPSNNLCIEFNVFDCLFEVSLSFTFYRFETIGLFHSIRTVTGLDSPGGLNFSDRN